MSAVSTGLQAFLEQETASFRKLRILEAGCGSRNNIRFDERVHWVGIDISAKQLERNSGLHEKIQGDLQTYELPENSVDMVVCWDVLEHLAQPEAALERFVKATKPGGLIVLKIPNLHSLKGQITKRMPHGIHVLWYQHIHGRNRTKREDGGPFPTYLRSCIAPSALRKFASSNHLDVPFEAYYDVSSVSWMRRKQATLLAYRFAFAAAKLMSLGRLGDSEFIIVMRKV